MFSSFIILDNGVRLIYTPMKKSGIVYCGLMIDAGSRNETNENNGVAHFIEHAVFKGSQNRKSYQILNRLESVGGELNAYTTREKTCYYSVTLKKYFERSIELLTDLVFNPIFPLAEIIKEKSVIKDEIEMYEDSPEESIFDDFNLHAFPSNSLGHNILGTQQSIENLEIADIVDFWKRNYVPQNVVISIVGNLSSDKVEKIANRYFGQLKASTFSEKKPAFDQYQRFEKSITKDFQQVHCLIGNQSYSIFDKKRYVLTLINNVLGGDWMSSRLNMSVREKYAYAYNISSNYSAYRDTGTFSVQLGTDGKYLNRCISLINKEFKKLRETKLSVIQLNRAKTQLMSQFEMYIENPGSLMQIHARQILDHGRIISRSEYFEHLNKISSQEVIEVANEILNPDELSMLIFLNE